MKSKQVISDINLSESSTATSETVENEENNEETNGDLQIVDTILEEQPQFIKMFNYEQLATKYKTQSKLKANSKSGQPVAKRKTGRVNLNKDTTSPKSSDSTSENCVIDCLQQASLNGFLQIKDGFNQSDKTQKKSPRKYQKKVKNLENNEETGFKISNALFMSPKSKNRSFVSKLSITYNSSLNNFKEAFDNEVLMHDEKENLIDSEIIDEKMASTQEHCVKINSEVINIDETSVDIIETNLDDTSVVETPTLKNNAFQFLMDRTRLTPPAEKSSPEDDNTKKRKLDLQNEDDNQQKPKRRRSGPKNKDNKGKDLELIDNDKLINDIEIDDHKNKGDKDLKIDSNLQITDSCQNKLATMTETKLDTIKDTKKEKTKKSKLKLNKDLKKQAGVLPEEQKKDCSAKISTSIFGRKLELNDKKQNSQPKENTDVVMDEKPTKVSPLTIKLKKIDPKTTTVNKLKLKKIPKDVKVVIDDENDLGTIKEHLTDEIDDSPCVRRSRRVRKSIIDLTSSNNLLVNEEKTPKNGRKRLSSESSVDSVASATSTKSTGKSKTKKVLQNGNNGKKVASIFDKAKPKIKLSPASLAARESFLRSGVPESLKQKQQKLEESRIELEETYFPFSGIKHIEQRCRSSVWSLQSVQVPLLPTQDDRNYIDKVLKSSVIGLTAKSPSCDVKVQFKTPVKGLPLHKQFLQILDDKPNYPVRHLFVTFGDRNGYNYRPPKQKKSKSLSKMITQTKPVVVNDKFNDHTMWTKKYRPKSSTDLLGNVDNVKSLKKWLQTWLDVVGGPGGDMFDADGASNIKNTTILYGKPGCGKSATVYALCEELAINVLEVNVSSRRTGKQLLQQMHEATQSHQVRKHNDDEQGAKMCLLLIDDVDLVYQQDENFTRELHTLITTSKRPIILITNDYSVPHVIKYVNQQYPVLSFAGLSANSMATYLQILCLLEGVTVDKQTVSMLLEWNLGDMRRTLLQLQFWLGSGGDSIQNLNKDEGKSQVKRHSKCIQALIPLQPGQILQDFVDLGVLWWNIPTITGLQTKPTTKEVLNTKKANKKTELKQLKNYANFMDSISFCDTLNRTEGITGGNEPDTNGLELFDSVELNPRTDYFKTDRYLTEELNHKLLEAHCQSFVTEDGDYQNIVEGWHHAPPVKFRRWRAKQQNCAVDFQRAVPIQVKQDKSGFFKDYFPYLRELSRSEEIRRDNTPKRGNRGFNILGTAGIYDITASDLKVACKMLQVENCHYV